MSDPRPATPASPSPLSHNPLRLPPHGKRHGTTPGLWELTRSIGRWRAGEAARRAEACRSRHAAQAATLLKVMRQLESSEARQVSAAAQAVGAGGGGGGGGVLPIGGAERDLGE